MIPVNIKVMDLAAFSPGDLRKATLDQEKVDEVKAVVQDIIDNVSSRKDAALLDYTRKFDKVDMAPGELKVSEREIKDAFDQVDAGLVDALKVARDNIKAYHQKQIPADWWLETTKGITTGCTTRPLENVGLYVPGLRAFYPSTVLMCAVPAKAAGVDKLVMATPPKKDKSIDPLVLVAASIAGVDEIYKAGGAQAISALAFGTETIPAVDKIVGPGNIYVSTAKQLLQDRVMIDSPAGPSEVLIIAGEDSNVKYLALDLLAQAEHDPDAISIGAVTSKDQAEALLVEIENLLPQVQRKEIIETSLEKNGLIINLNLKTTDAGFVQAIEKVINEVAPEHLELFLDDSTIDNLLPRVRNAGAIFLGEDAPVALGDYASGTNHVLPTGGMARRYSALNVLEFLKIIPITRASKEGLVNIKEVVSKLARHEKLFVHARSVEERVDDIEKSKKIK